MKLYKKLYLSTEAMAKQNGGHLKEKQRSQVEDITSIAQAVTEGDIQTVKTIIRKHPNMVDNPSYCDSIYVVSFVKNITAYNR